MRSSVPFLALVVASLGCATPGGIRSSPKSAADAAAVIKADTDFDADTAARGLDGWLAWFEDGTTTWKKDELVHGKENYREMLGRLFANPKAKLRWQPTYGEATGDLGFTTGRWQIHETGDDGKESIGGTGKYATIWRRQSDGSWKAIFDMGNDDRKQ